MKISPQPDVGLYYCPYIPGQEADPYEEFWTEVARILEKKYDRKKYSITLL